MHIILGGTGQVGSAAAHALLRQGESVTVITRHVDHGSELEAAGAHIAVVDIRDAARLRQVFRSGKRALLLNPPAPPSTDTDAEERANVATIMEALDGSGLEKVIAVSTYGAHPGERCGDLTVLYEFEQLLKAQPIPAAINRGAYYMSNWSGLLEIVRSSGTLPSFIPSDMAIPMVAPQDLGAAAAQRLLASVSDTDLRYIEGPEHYTPNDVAGAFSEALSMSIEVTAIPRDRWEATFMQLGFSKAAAHSYTRMTEAVVDGGSEKPVNPERGGTTLRDYILDIVKKTR